MKNNYNNQLKYENFGKIVENITSNKHAFPYLFSVET